MTSELPKSTPPISEIEELQNQINSLQTKLSRLQNQGDNCRIFEIVATHTSNSVLIVNPEGVAMWVNPSFEKLSGFQGDDIVGKTTEQFLMGPETKLETVQQIWQQMQQKQSFTYEVVQYNQDGEPYQIITNGEPILDAHGNLIGYAMIETDITLLKIMETALADAHRAAEEKEAAKTNLLANLSHEFRTPINGILGLSELLQSTSLDEEQLDYIDSIKASGEVLFELIQNLLELTDPKQIDRSDLKEICIPEHFAKATKKFLHQCQEKNLEFQLCIHPNVPKNIKAPWDSIRKILHHLCENAIKFTPSGTIAVYVDAGRPNLLTISVCDTGIGISPDILPRIFDEYFQGDESHTRSYGGIGLGLSLAQKLACTLGTDIRVESTPNEGSKLSFDAAFSL